jgi:hypothetical protein
MKPVNTKALDLARHRHELEEDCVYWTKAGEIIVTKKGFITDGASIPRIAWSLIGSPMRGKYVNSAFIHDDLYKRGLYSRKKTDDIFLEAMEMLGVNWLRRKIMWVAVRLGAWIAWNRYRKAK